MMMVNSGLKGLKDNLNSVFLNCSLASNLVDAVWPNFLLTHFPTELEWMLGQVGAVKTKLESNPRKEVHDVMAASLKQSQQDNDDDNDW